MFLISLNYLSFVYLASGLINALTWVNLLQTPDCHCWVTTLAESLVTTLQMKVFKVPLVPFRLFEAEYSQCYVFLLNFLRF